MVEGETDISDPMTFPKGLGENSLMGSHSLKLYRQQSSYRFHEWKPWLRAAWACHIAFSIFVIVWGCIDNDGRKFIPTDVTTMDVTTTTTTTAMACSRGFVNVFASSMDEPGALICCGTNGRRDNSVGATTTTATTLDDDDGVCSSPPGYMIFARRLARFPEAWLLPLFPLFLRGIVHMIHQYRQRHQLGPPQGAVAATEPYSKAQNKHARRRFYLYIALIQVRGWVLYLLFNQIEEYFVSPVGQNCWYERYLHPNYSSCEGQRTDFSDHIVLYFAQILPIPLTEVLHSFIVPFWMDSHGNGSTSGSIGSKHLPTTTRPTMGASIIPGMLICGMLYLYIITFMGVYKTAAYFHTWPEIVNGYLVSLLVQVPLLVMQCTSLLDNATTYFFGYASS